MASAVKRRPPNAGKGRPKGVPNKTTAAMRAAWVAAFDAIKYGEKTGGHEALTAWASDNPTEFYKLAARLIPQEVTGADGGPIAHTMEHVWKFGSREVKF